MATPSDSAKKRHGGKPFTKTRTRKAHKARQILPDGGEEWYRSDKAAEYVEQSAVTLWLWRDRKGKPGKCPWLNGEAIQTRKLQTAYNRTVTYYRKKDLDRIREAQAKRQPVPEYPGLVYVEDAAKKIGVSARTLRRLQKVYGPAARTVEKTAKSTDGRALPRSYVPAEFVEAILAVRRQQLQPLPADRLSVKEAAKLLGVKTGGIHALVRRGRLQAEPGHKVVDAAPREGGSPLRYRRKATLVFRESVERLLAERGAAKPAGGGEPMPSAESRKLPDVNGVDVGRLGPVAEEVEYGTVRVKNADGPLTVRLDPEQVAQIIRILAEPKVTGKAAAATPPSQPAESIAARGSRGPGRARSGETWDMYEYCYVRFYICGDKQAQAREGAARWFPEVAPEKAKYVTQYARRYADKYNLPMGQARTR